MPGHQEVVRRLADRVTEMARTTHAPDAAGESDLHEVHTLENCPFAFGYSRIARNAELDLAKLCAWCGSRGSGTPEVDDAAYVVLVLLRAMGVGVARVRWSEDIAEFLFRKAGKLSAGRTSVHGLIDTDHAELALSLARQHSVPV